MIPLSPVVKCSVFTKFQFRQWTAETWASETGVPISSTMRMVTLERAPLLYALTDALSLSGGPTVSCKRLKFIWLMYNDSFSGSVAARIHSIGLVSVDESDETIFPFPTGEFGCGGDAIPDDRSSTDVEESVFGTETTFVPFSFEPH